MATYLVNQNMRAWSPGSATRVAAYASAALPAGTPYPGNWPVGLAPGLTYGFGGVAQSCGPSVVVAGLTEVVTPTPMGSLAAVLAPLVGPGATVYAVLSGLTALGGQEYTVIGVRAGVALLALGFVAFGGGSQGGSASAELRSPAPPSGVWAPELPSLDYRGIAFVVVQPLGFGAPLAVGFLHNTETLSTKPVTPQLVPWGLKRMSEVTPYAYLGGDFNVPPYERVSRAPAYLYFAQVGAAFPPVFTGSVPGGTTYAGSMIDFWLSNVDAGNVPPGGIVPQATVSTWTMDGKGPAASSLMSDHAAIVLSV